MLPAWVENTYIPKAFKEKCCTQEMFCELGVLYWTSGANVCIELLKETEIGNATLPLANEPSPREYQVQLPFRE